MEYSGQLYDLDYVDNIALLPHSKVQMQRKANILAQT